MTSLDPSHLPTGHRQDHPSRGQAIYSQQKASGSRALPIPDLRFEQSYLRSLQRFIHNDLEDSRGNGYDKQRNTSGEKTKTIQAAGKVSGAESAAPGLYDIPLRFDWGWIIYITTRDQVLSPLAQGAVWALASHFLRPCLRNLGAWVRIHVKRSWMSIFPPFEPHIHGGVGWMRDQFRGFTVGGIGTNIALAK